ncbi:MAG: DNA gyrase/topoisomerase IV subunit A [Bacteroidetes bacterium]|nr:DNA gyrase/topoisomerase IV subunit A [Bacteroidota bacterium]
MSNEEENTNNRQEGEFENSGNDEVQNVIHISGMYKNWFLDYASYVILERAVPYIEDGLKPVQRRILHSLKDLDDGRYNKVANVIGHCMKYHPHGDASIGDALVALGQKELLIDCQGNWGNTLTGDSAAAPRYIEARLSKFALDVVFNAKTTIWQASYDGRNREPVTLPVKFPLLLAQGVEGIAVGLACKIMPHNFIELIDGSIDILRGKKTHIVPDFLGGGMADFSNYNDGLRGGKVRVRAKISQLDKKTLVINEIPFGTTTTSLIDSILSANDKEKIKIRKVEDNTSDTVEIVIHLPAGISPDKTIDGLYAFTDCEVSISPNACIIEDDKPRFVGVNEMLKISTHKTLALLKKELEIELGELGEQWHFSSLEKIFIEKRIYRDIEEAETWEAVIAAIDKGLKPYKKKFKREITVQDIERLTEIKIKRISKFDSFKADELIKGIEDQIKQVQHHLDNLIEFAIEYFKNLKKKYGKGKERKTEIKSFDTIVASRVAVANEKLYVNREEGFAGFGLKKDEFIAECSDIDDIIVFREDGTMTVSKIADKAFVGKGILHINVFKKNDERTVYNMIYRDGTKGSVMIKRFSVTGVTRDKLYDLTKGTKGSEVLYFTANPNGEAEVVTVFHKALPGIRKLQFDMNFGEIAIKGRASQGNIVTKYPVRKIVLAEKGVSTLGARMIWFDDTVQRLNTESRGQYLGEFSADDKILTIMQSGHYKLHNFDLENHFEEDMIVIEKLKTDKPITAIYLDGEKKEYFVKRFLIEPSDKKVLFISEFEGSLLECVSTDLLPVAEIKFYKNKGKDIANEEIKLADFISVKGLKAKGNRLSQNKIKEINLMEPIPSPDEKKEDDKPSFDLERMERLKAIKDNLDEMDSQIKLEF